uniref:Uncharacterized protein n=1 Tax=Pygocentrus nattereri TaxID=42514 RepID=A0AAR2L301_PYGNA
VIHGTLFSVLQCCLQRPNTLSRRTYAHLLLCVGISPLRQRFILFFSFSFSYFLFHCSAVSSRLIEAVFLIVLALRGIDLVSASLKPEGEQQMNMVVLQFPPRESCRIRVILLSRYGTWVFCLHNKKY